MSHGSGLSGGTPDRIPVRREMQMSLTPSSLRLALAATALVLSGVHYIDSTRLGELIASHVTVSRKGGRLRLVGTPNRIIELLAIAGLEGVFERFDSTEAASAGLN